MTPENERKQAAALCRQLIKERPFADQQWARLALGVAARAIERGRLLTAGEKLENLRKALAEDADEIVAPAEDVPEKCHACAGTGRYMGRFGHNDPECPSCSGSGWEDGQRRHPVTGEIFAPLRR